MDARRTFLKQTLGAGLGLACDTTPGSRIRLVQQALAQGNTPEAMIVSTTAPTAIRSGLQIMREGGSAADAAIATAFSQIAICAGCWVSYAGRMTATYFDASTKKLHSLNACYDAPLAEVDPFSIPRPPTPTGRSVLVPGFMAGMESLHDKFGKAQFAKLFQPAIQIANEGIPLTRQMARLIKGKEKVLTRFPEGRKVFHNDAGRLHAQGELFHQKELAKTLEQVAKLGAQYMYQGEWGERLVQVAQREGGRISLEDLANYKPTWTEPLTTSLRSGVTIAGLPTPNRGCPVAIACLNLADHAGLSDLGHFTESVEALDRVLKIQMASRLIYVQRGRDALAEVLGKKALSLNDFADQSLGKKLWKIIQSDRWQLLLNRLSGKQPKRSEHSDSIVAVDSQGNVITMIHTINTAGWGQTGLFVDGVSIPDSGANQQGGIAEAGPGGRVPDHGPPLIAMKNGAPILAGCATGSGNVNASWQNFVNVLFYDMTPQQASDVPNFYNQTFETKSLSHEFAEKAKAAGVPIQLKPNFGGFEMGFWTGIRLDPTTGTIEGGKIRKLNGIVASY